MASADPARPHISKEGFYWRIIDERTLGTISSRDLSLFFPREVTQFAAQSILIQLAADIGTSLNILPMGASNPSGPGMII